MPDGAQDFAYTTTGTGLSGFTLDDDGVNTGTGGDILNTKEFTNLVPGSYSVTETLPVTNYDLTNLVCVDSGTGTNTVETLASGEAAITLGAGGSVTCTYTNTQRGSITIIKNTVPDGAQDFAYTTTGTGLSGFTLDDDGVNTGTGGDILNTKEFTNLVPGSYSVTETLPVTNYDLTMLACTSTGTGTSATPTLATGLSSITLGAGGSVTCTYTNSKLPTIVVRKITTGIAGGPFTFSTTGGHGFTTPFSLTTATAGVAVQQSFVIGAAGIGGNFSVTESTLAAGFVLTDVGCVVTVAGAEGTVPGSNLATKTGTIENLAAGATVTCTFTNSGVGTTRTQGFWSTHLSLVQAVWSPAGGTIGTIVHNGMTDAERTLCGHVLTVPEVMGGFWSNIAKTTTGAKRSALDHARMNLLQQLLAAILNNQLFGSSPSGSISITQAKAAFCTGNLAQVKAAHSAMAAFNESGDSGLFTPGASADPKAGKAIADLDFWDALP